MPRPTWSRRGFDNEREIAKIARDKGLIAIRSAGSLGKIDLVICDLQARSIKFIQMKGQSISQSQKSKLEEEMKQLNGEFRCSFEVKTFEELKDEYST